MARSSGGWAADANEVGQGDEGRRHADELQLLSTNPGDKVIRIDGCRRHGQTRAYAPELTYLVAGLEGKYGIRPE